MYLLLHCPLTIQSKGMIQIRINDPWSLGSRCIKGTEESLPRVDSWVSPWSEWSWIIALHRDHSKGTHPKRHKKCYLEKTHLPSAILTQATNDGKKKIQMRDNIILTCSSLWNSQLVLGFRNDLTISKMRLFKYNINLFYQRGKKHNTVNMSIGRFKVN